MGHFFYVDYEYKPNRIIRLFKISNFTCLKQAILTKILDFGWSNDLFNQKLNPLEASIFRDQLELTRNQKS
jgi:hypothetical protein